MLCPYVLLEKICRREGHLTQLIGPCRYEINELIQVTYIASEASGARSRVLAHMQYQSTLSVRYELAIRACDGEHSSIVSLFRMHGAVKARQERQYHRAVWMI